MATLVTLGPLSLFSLLPSNQVAATGLPSLVVTPTTSIGTQSVLDGVSCFQQSMCMAVGGGSTKSHYVPLVELWNGGSWSTTPGPTRLQEDLGRVSCPSSTFCIAVGSKGDGRRARPYAATWNGSGWTVTHVPIPKGTDSNLTSISCTSPNSCVAVGDYYKSIQKSFSEVWNGTTWRLVETVNPLNTSSYLASVSCGAASTCQAVGDESPQDPLIEDWNGQTWSVVPSPTLTNPYLDEADPGQLIGISCTLSTDCVAVGNTVEGGLQATLIESWNGSSWSVSSSPNPDSANNELYAVSCSGDSFCLAVGTESNNSITWDTLGELWNGASWSVIQSASPGTSENYLIGVSCSAPMICQTVGSTTSDSSSDATLAESLAS